MKPGLLSSIWKMLSSTAFSQALLVLAAPMLSRIFSPDEIGTYQLFVSITGVLSIVACLRYERSLVIPAEDKDALHLLAGALMLGGGATILISGAVWLFMRGDDGSFFDFVLILLTALLMGSMNLFSFWATRWSHYSAIARSRIAKAAVTLAVQLGVGYWLWPQTDTLITGYVAGHLAAVLILLTPFRGRKTGWKPSVSGMKKQLVEHMDCLRYAAPAALLNTLSMQLPVFLLALFFSKGIVGLYALGQRVLAVPIGICSQAISQVIYQHCNRLMQEGAAIGNTVETAFRYLIAVSLGPAVLLIAAGDSLFSAVFGDEWREAGVFVRILTPWLWLVFLVSPLSLLFHLFGKQRLMLHVEIAILIVRAASLCIGGWMGNATIALGMFSFTSSLAYLLQGKWLMEWAKVHVGQVLRMTFRCLLAAVPFTVLPWIGERAGDKLVLSLSLFLMLAYYAFALMGDPALRSKAVIRIVGKRKTM